MGDTPSFNLDYALQNAASILFAIANVTGCPLPPEVTQQLRDTEHKMQLLHIASVDPELAWIVGITTELIRNDLGANV